MASAFAAVAILTACATVFVLRRAVRPAVTAGFFAMWLAVTYVLASSGALRFDSRPPTIVLLILIANIGAAVFALSRVGARVAESVPLAALAALQSFRLPLELVMHRAAEEGVMPPQMSYGGYNFDIVTGALAIVVAFLARHRAIAWAWNILGTLLLTAIVVISVISSPLPLRAFHNEPANVWVTQPPFVWLVAVLVPIALAGHILVFRALRRRREDGAAT
ncbi:MAG TPA: hypothetical protein VEU30_15145 [Thermoanaerobaculia bacterium]|nr:hypothetical protein [Thermoanaerobaculia bacterium]